jgi:protocatechuate 3,4-dioxygenase beta subunit
MRDLDERNITEAVLETFAAAPDPRFKAVMTSLLRHLHDFAREVELTPEEWIGAIRFLTAVGHNCGPSRQEFILLSDTLGFSALVNMLNNRTAAGGTPSSLLGPFFRENAPAMPLGADIAGGDGGERILVEGRVTDVAGRPLPGAAIDVWQNASSGLYDMQGPDPDEMSHRARLRADAQGRYRFVTVRPLGYSIPTDGPVGAMLRDLGRHGFRPAHIHFLLGAEGHQELATALYVAGDAHIGSDAVFGVSRSLVVALLPPDPAGAAPTLRRIAFDFTLRPAGDARPQRVGADPATVGRAAE